MGFAWCTCASTNENNIYNIDMVACTKYKPPDDRLCIVGHNADKFLLVNLAILVKIKLVDHCLSVHDASTQSEKKQKGIANAQLVLFEAVTNLFGDASEVAYGYLARVVIVEKLKRATDLVHRVACQYPFRHCQRESSCMTRMTGLLRTDFSKVIILEEPMACLVVVAEGFEHLGLLEVKTERAHGDFQLVIVDRAVLVRVEKLKRLFDLLLLLFGELWAHGGVRATVCATPGFGSGAGGVHGEWRDGEKRNASNFVHVTYVHVVPFSGYLRFD